MEYVFFIEGFIIGVFIAAPVGPVGILCINRTLSQGRKAGFISGLGAVTVDGFYAAVAAYGISVITSFMSDNSLWIRLVGGIFLAIIGAKIILTEIDFTLSEDKTGSSAENYASSAIVTVSNPLTVVLFGAIFASLGLGGPGTGFLDSTAMVAGVVAGSALCWFILSSLVDMLRSRFRFSVLKTFNRISGAVLIGFSCLVVMTAFGWWQ